MKFVLKILVIMINVQHRFKSKIKCKKCINNLHFEQCPKSTVFEYYTLKYLHAVPLAFMFLKSYLGIKTAYILLDMGFKKI